jgi:hypothetical protein
MNRAAKPTAPPQNRRRLNELRREIALRMSAPHYETRRGRRRRRNELNAKLHELRRLEAGSSVHGSADGTG